MKGSGMATTSGLYQRFSPLQPTQSPQSAAVLDKIEISCFRQQCHFSGMNSENDWPNGTHLVAVRGFLLQLEEMIVVRMNMYQLHIGRAGHTFSYYPLQYHLSLSTSNHT
jgi:hypothetical protein